MKRASAAALAHVNGFRKSVGLPVICELGPGQLREGLPPFTDEDEGFARVVNHLLRKVAVVGVQISSEFGNMVLSRFDFDGVEEFGQLDVMDVLYVKKYG
jgi:hypothetical protein